MPQRRKQARSLLFAFRNELRTAAVCAGPTARHLALALGAWLLGARAASGQQSCGLADVTYQTGTAAHTFSGRVLRSAGILNRVGWAMWIQPDRSNPTPDLEVRGPPRHDPPEHVYLELHPSCRAAEGERVTLSYRAPATSGGTPLVLRSFPMQRRERRWRSSLALAEWEGGLGIRAPEAPV